MSENRIKERRKMKHLTQKELAEKVLVSPQVISNWERGYTSPNGGDLSRLAATLDCSADFLLGLTNEPHHKFSDIIFKAGMVVEFGANKWTMKKDTTWEELSEQYAEFPKSTKGYDMSYTFEINAETEEEFRTVSVYPKKTTKDERDIAKKLESILGDLDNQSSLAFNGEPMDDHTRELVRAQIESNLRVAKEMARKKFTPKKYQTDDND